MINRIKSFFFTEEKPEHGSVTNSFNQGTSGTENYSGYYAEEYLHKLRDKARATEYDKMRRSDSQVKMLLSCIKNPIKSAKWKVAPAEQDNPEYEKHAKLVEKALFQDMRTHWKKFINESLTMLEFGHAVFERTHKVVKFDPELGTYISIKDLSWRSPKTIERWDLHTEGDCKGELKSIAQYAYGDLGVLIDIKACNLIVFVLDMEGSDYQGTSILRACYGNYFKKNNYSKINAIGIEKFAVPTPIGTIPPGQENSEAKDTFEQVLRKYTSHQCNYIIKPEGFNIDWNNNTYDPQKVEVSIDNEDKRMAKAILANFLELGQGSGSYALSNDLSDFFLSSIKYIAEAEIAETLNKTIVKEIIDLNFPGVKKYPKLIPYGIDDKAGKEFAEIISMLTEKKIIIADDVLEKDIRKRYDLPEKSDQGVREQAPSQTQFGLSEKIRIANYKRVNY